MRKRGFSITVPQPPATPVIIRTSAPATVAMWEDLLESLVIESVGEGSMTVDDHGNLLVYSEIDPDLSRIINAPIDKIWIAFEFPNKETC